MLRPARLRLGRNYSRPLLRGGHRRHLGHREVHRFAGNSGHHQAAALAHRDVADLALVDLQDDAVAVQRGDFKQFLAGFHRRADLLAEVAADDDAVKRRLDLGAGDLR